MSLEWGSHPAPDLPMAPKRMAQEARFITNLGRSRKLAALAILVGTAAGFALVARHMGSGVVAAATSPNWVYLAGAFVAWALIQPLRALVWAMTLRQPVEFRAIYAASAVGSFLDTVVPGRLGEISKLGILRVATGRRLICSEDWEMWVRIAAHYPIWYEVEPLAFYRMHWDSNTGRHVRTGEDMRYTREAIDIFKAYLPPGLARPVVGRARETYALAALRTAEQMAQQQDMAAVFVQVREALKLSRSPRVIRKILKLLARRSHRLPSLSP